MDLPVPTSVDPSPIHDYAGAARLAHWVTGAGEILLVGLLVPVAMIVVGAPVVLVVRLLIALAQGS